MAVQPIALSKEYTLKQEILLLNKSDDFISRRFTLTVGRSFYYIDENGKRVGILTRPEPRSINFEEEKYDELQEELEDKGQKAVFTQILQQYVDTYVNK